ncbi:MAG: class I SAM-dependent methyltransferase [Gammaproteobacteria bacterium]
MKKMLALASLCFSVVAMPAIAQHDHNLMMAVDATNRTEANKARDVYRHPYETLSFFGIKKDFTVVEMWPGSGWYTEILAPYLKADGQLIAATFDRSDNPPAAYMGNAVKGYDAFLASNPVYSDVQVSEQVSERVSVIAEPGSVDLILDFRNAHNWIPAGGDNIVMAWHAALKTGGIVGIVDHRRDADEPFQPGTGYIHEQQLIDLMTKHGFALAAKSEINANPMDTKDHEGGVWNLPPNLRGVSDADRPKFEAIGESDRLTMKFVKE